VAKVQIVRLIERFRELKTVHFDQVPEDFDWTILRNICLLRLTYVYMSLTDGIEVFADDEAEAEIIRFIMGFSRTEPCKASVLFLDCTFKEIFAINVVKVRVSPPQSR
jgi:hypothetical protein